MKISVSLAVMTLCCWAQEGTGPYPAILENDPTLATHTVYRPKDLDAVKGKMPILSWGNGGCSNNGLSHRNYLMEIASHGFFAIAIGPPVGRPPALDPGAGGAKGAPKQAPAAGAPKQAPAGMASKSSQLVDAMNWAIAENDRKGGPYYKKLDTSKIAVMGMSCGGIQAYAVATDPRIKLVGIWNSGILNTPSNGKGPAMEDVRKDQLEKLHTPIFYVTGDKTDIAYENGLDDFKRITKVRSIHMYRDGIGHGGTYGQPNGGEFAKVAVGLLEWQLKGNKESAKMFLGANCGLCQDSNWHVSKKGYE